MKTAIVYYSKHHGNTKKLLDAISDKKDVILIDAVLNPDADLSGYDLVGFASGIYFSKFHKSVLEAAEKLLSGQKVFFMYTYGAKKQGYTKAVREVVEKRNAKIEGGYGCFGFDTFGPLKFVGGLAKGHPDQEEIKSAVSFFEKISKE